MAQLRGNESGRGVRTGIGMVFVLLLAACGGDETTPTSPPSAAGGISLTFVASSTAVEAGETVVLDAAATNANGAALATIITCDGGTLYQESFLLTEDSATSQTINCIATASEAGSAAITRSISIAVAPAVSGITLLEAYEGKLTQGQIGALSARGFPIGNGEVKVTLGGVDIDATPVAQETLAFTVPANTATGAQLLQLKTADRIFSVPIEVSTTVLRAAASEIVGEYLEAGQLLVTDLLNSPGTSASQAIGYRQLLADISAAKSSVASQDQAELRSLALLIQANNLDFFALKSPSSCFKDREGFVLSAIVVGAAIPAILAPTGLTQVAGVIALYGALREIRSQITSVGECIESFGDFVLKPYSPDDFGARKLASVSTIPLELDFVNGDARTLTVSSEEQLAPQFSDLKFYIRLLRSALDFAPLVSEALKSDIKRLDGTRSVDVPSAQLTVTKVSGEGVEISSSVSGDQLVITAHAESPDSEEIPFSFSVSLGDQSSTFSAILISKAPVAYDVAATVSRVTTRIPLQAKGADSFRILSQPGNAHVAIDTDTGDAILTAYAPMKYGQMQFDYLAVNRFGESNVATVLVEFVADYEINKTIQFVEKAESFRYSGNDCVAETQTVKLSTTRISDTEYRMTASPYRGLSTEPSISKILNDGRGGFELVGNGQESQYSEISSNSLQVGRGFRWDARVGDRKFMFSVGYSIIDLYAYYQGGKLIRVEQGRCGLTSDTYVGPVD